MAKKPVGKEVAKTPPPAQKPARQPVPPRTPQKPYDPKDYEFDEEPEVQVESEAAPSAAEPVGEPASAVSPPPKQSPYLVRMAQELNLREEDIAGLSNDELSGAILLQQRRVIDLQESERRLQPRGPLVSAPVATPPEEDDLGLDPDVHESIAAAFKRLAKENKELRAAQAKGEEREQARERETRNEKIDRVFQSLTDYHGIFGKGALGELAPEELACRQAVLTVATADQSKAPFESKIVKAVKTIYRQQAAAPPPAAAKEPAYEQSPGKPAAPTNGADYEDKELAKRRAVWQASTVAEPTARKGAPEPKGMTKAKKTFMKGMQEIGMGDNQLAEQLTAELPD